MRAAVGASAGGGEFSLTTALEDAADCGIFSSSAVTPCLPGRSGPTMELTVTKSEIFRAAWTVARETASQHATLRIAFSAALRGVYASLKAPAAPVVFEAPVIRGEIRGNGNGARAWIALIVGTDGDYGLDRSFVKKDSRHVSRSGRSGTILWTLDAPGLYEIRGLQPVAGQATIGQLDSGFIVVDAAGAIERVSKDRAEEMAEAMGERAKPEQPRSASRGRCPIRPDARAKIAAHEAAMSAYRARNGL